MTACSLDPQWLGHPCDTAMGVLIPPAESRISLYLFFGAISSDETHTEDRYYTVNVVRTECLAGVCVASKRESISHDSKFQLPASDTDIDLVVLSARARTSLWTQRSGALIKEIRRVLKPDGELLIAYEPDSGDCGIEKNLVHRLRGYARMLGNSLFSTDRHRIASALKRNGLTHSEWFVPSRDQSGCLTTIQGMESRLLPTSNWKRHCKMRAATQTIVRASASILQPSQLKRCALESVTKVAPESGALKSAHISALLVTPKEKVVAMANVNGADIVIRIPLSVRALQACQQNMRALESLQSDPIRAGLAPRPLFEASLHGQYFSAESRIKGTPFVTLPPFERRLEPVETLIKTLNPTSRLTQRKLESSTYDDLVGAPLSNILPRIARAEDRAALAQYFAGALQNMPYAAGVSHGDFSLRNIFTQDHKISGVIDWDEGAMNGLPVLDAISHLCSRQGHRSGRFSETLCRLATRQWPESAELAFLDRCYAYFGVEPRQHFALVMMYWLQIVGSQSQFWFSHGTDFNRTHINDIVCLISRRAALA